VFSKVQEHLQSCILDGGTVESFDADASTLLALQAAVNEALLSRHKADTMRRMKALQRRPTAHKLLGDWCEFVDLSAIATHVNAAAATAASYMQECMDAEEALDCVVGSESTVKCALKAAVVYAAIESCEARQADYGRLSSTLQRKSKPKKIIADWVEFERRHNQREHNLVVHDDYLESLTEMERRFHDFRQLVYDRGTGAGPRWVRRCKWCILKGCDCIFFHPILVATDCCGSNLSTLQRLTAAHPAADSIDLDDEDVGGSDLDVSIDQLGAADMGHVGVKLFSACQNYWLVLLSCKGVNRGVWLGNFSRVLLSIWEDPVFGKQLQLSALTLADLRHRDRQDWTVFMHLLAESTVQATLAIGDERVVVKLCPETIRVSSTAGPKCLKRPVAVHVPDHLVAYVVDYDECKVHALMLSSPVYKVIVGKEQPFSAPVDVTSIGNFLLVADKGANCVYYANITALAEPHSRVEAAADDDDVLAAESAAWHDKPRAATRRAAQATWRPLQTKMGTARLFPGQAKERGAPRYLAVVAARKMPFAEDCMTTARLYVVTTTQKLLRVDLQLHTNDPKHIYGVAGAEVDLAATEFAGTQITSAVSESSQILGLAICSAHEDALYPDRVCSARGVDTICMIVDVDIVLVTIDGAARMVSSQVILRNAEPGALAIDAENRRLAFTRPRELSVYECDVAIWECTKPRCVAGPGVPGKNGDVSAVGSSARFEAVTNVAFFGRSLFVVDERRACIKLITSAAPLVDYTRMADSYMRPFNLSPNGLASSSNVRDLGWSGQAGGVAPAPPVLRDDSDSDRGSDDGSDAESDGNGGGDMDDTGEYELGCLFGQFGDGEAAPYYRVGWARCSDLKATTWTEPPSLELSTDVQRVAYLQLRETLEQIQADNRGDDRLVSAASVAETFEDSSSNLEHAIELFGYGLVYMSRLEELGRLRFGTAHGSGREGLMSTENRKAARLQYAMLHKLLALLRRYAPQMLRHITLGVVGSECNEHNNNFMRQKRTLMTQLEYAMHLPLIGREMAKAADGNLGYLYFTRPHSKQSRRSQYRTVQRRNARGLQL
jgi:hypothetical protein